MGLGDFFDITSVTETEKQADVIWRNQKDLLARFGLSSVLEDPYVLEIGPGYGVQLRYFVQQGIRAIGVDKHITDEAKDLPLVAGDAHNLPFADNSFDIVYSSMIFDPHYYANNNARIFSEISRVLKPGGVYCPAEGPCNIEEIKKTIQGTSLNVLGEKFRFIFQKSL